MKVSYSRVSTWGQCPHRFKLRYVDGVRGEPDTDPTSPLLTGTLIHRMIETDSETAVREYYDSIPITSDQVEEEIIKAEILAAKAREILPKGLSEVEIKSNNFIGYIDRLGDDGSIWDIKYSSHPDRYKGEQLQAYSLYYEKMTGIRIDKLHYLVIPRINIRLKKGETVAEFRNRLRSMAMAAKPVVLDYVRDDKEAGRFERMANMMLEDTQFPKHPSKLCEWCEYQTVCLGEDNMVTLPENVKREAGKPTKRKIWLYGAPFSGKTYLADKFPNALMLNTDGNIGFTSSPYVSIKDEVVMNGRITQKKLAWDVFKDIVDELEKKQNPYQTIIVDLVEDLYEHCRLWAYQKLGIEHESDNSFKAYDYVRTQFLSTMKRLVNLDYENIILISQEDTSRDITKRSVDKISTIKPNLQDKVALKVAGMVDIVGRVIAEDGKHIVSLKASEVVFGGGRLPITTPQIEATYERMAEDDK